MQWIADEPDVTIARLQSELDGHGLSLCWSTVWYFLNREGLSFKKTVYADEQNRPDVHRKQGRWMSWRGRFDPDRLLFVGETWVKTNMVPLRGRSPGGQRLKATFLQGHWKTVTFLAALRAGSVKAPCVFDGP